MDESEAVASVERVSGALPLGHRFSARPATPPTLWAVVPVDDEGRPYVGGSHLVGPDGRVWSVSGNPGIHDTGLAAHAIARLYEAGVTDRVEDEHFADWLMEETQRRGSAVPTLWQRLSAVRSDTTDPSSRSTHINTPVGQKKLRKNGTFDRANPLENAHSTSDRLCALSAAGSRTGARPSWRREYRAVPGPKSHEQSRLQIGPVGLANRWNAGGAVTVMVRSSQLVVRVVARRVLEGEHPTPVVAHAHDCPFLLFGHPECFLGTGAVGHLPGIVVVMHEQAESREFFVAGKLEHGDITVGVAPGQDRSSSCAIPDQNRLLRPVIDETRWSPPASDGRRSRRPGTRHLTRSRSPVRAECCRPVR